MSLLWHKVVEYHLGEPEDNVDPLWVHHCSGWEKRKSKPIAELRALQFILKSDVTLKVWLEIKDKAKYFCTCMFWLSFQIHDEGNCSEWLILGAGISRKDTWLGTASLYLKYPVSWHAVGGGKCLGILDWSLLLQHEVPSDSACFPSLS